MSRDLVVSDTSPIRALSHLGRMQLLPALFGRILVPRAVADELERPRSGFVALHLAQWPFIEIRDVCDLSTVQTYIAHLHTAEAHAIALAVEVGAECILMDEWDGRNCAIAAGLTPMGVLGVLLEAKRLKLLAEIRPDLDRLIGELRFRVSEPLRRQILLSAGEKFS